MHSAVIRRNLSAVNLTLKSQGRSILDFLTEAITTARGGLKTPSLIPVVIVHKFSIFISARQLLCCG